MSGARGGRRDGAPDHLVAERADAPVGERKLLVRRDARIPLEQVRERVRRELEDACRLAGVEEGDDVEPEVALQPEHVRVGAVHHLRESGDTAGA